MVVKTVRGVKEETWNQIKSEATRRNTTVGEYLQEMLESSKKYNELCWDHLLNAPKILSDKDAAGMKEVVAKLRREKGFRV